ncbi:MAG: glucose-6-phosphate isomerase, partial [Chloroflexi bacterium]|nr:glucose-6-phosphate isomerase [Chloroflexota bacterium]
LIAESLGKEGKGIVPIAGEPLLAPDHYGDDRFFVYLRLAGDDNAATDAASGQMASAGQPLLRLELRDRYDLGAEFFRWEFATAVAGSMLGIHPFDQPNVQEAKDLTGRLLADYRTSGRLPSATAGGDLGELLSAAAPGSYLAILAYLQPGVVVEQEIAALRRRASERYRVATTFGYGPRYLHSTGQLHKGGPASGLFLLLTAPHSEDAAIPQQDYAFGLLSDAQALGDAQALAARGRPVYHLRLGDDLADSIRKLRG